MYSIPTFEIIRDAILRDTKSLNPQADISVDSDHYVHASRLASCAVGQYAHQSWIVKQIFPDTADSDYLERHASLRGLKRKQATAADGTATISGEPNTVIDSGLQIKADNGIYVTTAQTSIAANGTANIAIRSEATGSMNNVTDVAARFMDAPLGVSSDLKIIKTQGGTDIETDSELLARLLEIIRRPPAGGNKYDYKNWALSVDGVTHAYVYPLRRGLGTVDIVITSGNNVPSDKVLADCQAYINDVRPVTAKDSLVLKPHISLVDIRCQVKLENVELASIETQIKTSLAEYFETLIPGDGIVRSQIEAAISNVSGVIDRVLLTPQANRNAQTQQYIEWFKLGNVTVTVM